MGIFHEATRQAIREMIEEFGEASRFGRILSDEDLEGAAGRVASFLEMTLELRAGLGLSQGIPAAGATASASAGNGRTNALPPKGNRTPPRAAPSASGASGNRLGLASGFAPASDPALRPAGFARTRAAAEVAVDHELGRGGSGNGRGSEEVRLPPQHDLRLPRKRVGATDAEKDSFTASRNKG